MTKRFNVLLLCHFLISVFLISCTPTAQTVSETQIETDEAMQLSATEIPPRPSATPQIRVAEVTRIVVTIGDPPPPTPTSPVFPMMDTTLIEPRPEFIRLVSPIEYSIVEFDFYSTEFDGPGGIRISSALTNGFDSTVCVNPRMIALVQKGDILLVSDDLWNRMTLLVNGEEKERFSESGLGARAWLPDDRDTKYIEGDDYCWFSPLQPGVHEAVFQFQQTSGDVQEYRWLFTIVE